MLILDQEKIFYFLSVALGISIAGIFAVILYYLLPSNRKGKDGSYAFLRITKGFEEYLGKLMDEEIKKLILELNQKAQYLITETINFYKKEIANFSQNLEKESLEMLSFNKNLQQKMIRETEEKIRLLSEEVEKEIGNFRRIHSQNQTLFTQKTESEVQRLSNDLMKKINLIYQSTAEKMDKKILENEKKIEEYKKEKIKDLDQKIYQIIAEVAKKTIGKTIDISTHEELVIDALEKAKKEKLF